MDKFNVSLSTVTIVGSVADGIFQLISPLVALTANKIGLKWAALMGCSISVVSLLVCCLFNNYLVFVIMYGGLMGAGVGFVYLPSITSCAFFFKERVDSTFHDDKASWSKSWIVGFLTCRGSRSNKKSVLFK